MKRPYAIEKWYTKFDAAYDRRKGRTPRRVGYHLLGRARYSTAQKAQAEADYLNIFLNPGQKPYRVVNVETGSLASDKENQQ